MRPKIGFGMVNDYLDNVTVGWFDPEDFPPDTVEGYAQCIERMKSNADWKGDPPYLKLAFEYILGGGPLCSNMMRYLTSDRYPYGPEEVIEIIQYAYKSIWPEEPPIRYWHYPDIELIQTRSDIASLNREWWSVRDQLNPDFDVKKVRYLTEAVDEALPGKPSAPVPKTGWWISPMLPQNQNPCYLELGDRFPPYPEPEASQIYWIYDNRKR
jgi:hypothetical protein